MQPKPNPQTIKNNFAKFCVAYESLNAKIQVWSHITLSLPSIPFYFLIFFFYLLFCVCVCVLHTRTCLDTEDFIARFIPVKPSNTAILYFEMVLPVFMDRMATNRVKYRVITLVGIQLDPRCYAYGLARSFLMTDVKNKNQEKDTLSHR